MQPHAYSITNNPASPTAPLITYVVALLRIYNTAINLTYTIAIGNQRPSEIQIFYFCPIREAKLTQNIRSEHPACTTDNKWRSSKNLLQCSLHDNHR
ncbi:Uncharacterised protein [Escherichia coli]|nr:Uncharacterised protein [Escherichia coli]CTU32130.1 Uncharacterised protein [Escherichia coli]CTV85093.1 Uncharacterised protein [Escherichia coli]CTW08388.1 Uncharacterised protein [Escherichia coli]CTX38623.1 Uncharacterised protein [Escherichia coli]